MSSTHLHPIEQKLLLNLKKAGSASPQSLSRSSGLDINAVMRGLDWLSSKGLVEIEERHEELLRLGREGERYVRDGLPERRLAELLREGERSMGELQRLVPAGELGIAIGWLKRKGAVRIEGDKVSLVSDAVEEWPDERLLKMLASGALKSSQLPAELKGWVKALLRRKDVLRLEEEVERKVSLTPKGCELAEGVLEVGESIGQLTPELLKDERWRGKEFRRYDVLGEVAPATVAKRHPLTRLIDEISEIFISLGFREIEGPIVESGFWNFDALFVPQDHPAREMQDTFYLVEPGTARLPDERLMAEVAGAHENGGATGSIGWGYRWSKELAAHTLLRTHTTATTIRHLAKKERLPIKVFSIGRVFRKERISFKHLPEFHQIEGIVVGDVSFRNLLGVLKEFYASMGFEQIRFRPAYFPYTEPSLEVEVFFEKKGRWIELGGAGIFRPEVTLPFGIEHPVLAWGLGLERLAMLRLDLEDIRAFYRSDIEWLRSLPL